MRSAADHQHRLKFQHQYQQHDNHVQSQKVYIAYNSINIMAKTIGESTADDSHGWIFEEVVYD